MGGFGGEKWQNKEVKERLQSEKDKGRVGSDGGGQRSVCAAFVLQVCVALPHGKVLLLNRSSLASLNHPPLPKYPHKEPPQLPLSSHSGTAAAATLTHTISFLTAETLTLCAQSCGSHTDLPLFILHHLQR